MKAKFEITKNGVKIEAHESIDDAYFSMREKIIEQATILLNTSDNTPTGAIVNGRYISLNPISLREVELEDGVYKIQLSNVWAKS